MSFLVVAILSLLWLGFFLPSYLQTRQSSSPYASATTFQESLRRISESQPTSSSDVARRTPPPARTTSSRVSARRRDVLAGLSGLVVASALLAVSFQGWMLWTPVPAVAALVGYVVILRSRVVRAHRVRRSTMPSQTAPVLVPVATDDGVIPSVRRRTEVEAPQTSEVAESDQLERIAG